MNSDINDITVKFCIFAGREKNLVILHKYIEKILLEKIIDEYHIFDFTRNVNDSIFLLKEYERLILIFPNRIFIHNNIENSQKINNKIKILEKQDWSPFYSVISQEIFYKKSIIIKCDDDILFIDCNGLKNAIKDRKKDDYSFLIHSNCINNNICAYYQKNIFKNLSSYLSAYPTGGILGILFENPKVAYSMHYFFVDECLKDIQNLYNFIIEDVYINTRISINFILINGEDCKYFKDIKYDDEYELSSYFPEKLFRPNKIKGDFITAHYSYALQEKIFNANDKLRLQYEKLVHFYINNNDKLDFIKNDKLLKKYISYEVQERPQELITVLNYQDNNLFYIKNIETNSYLYIDYNDDALSLHSTKKTFFKINQLDEKSININLGIYSLTRFNLNADFKNKGLLIKLLNDINEKNDKKIHIINKNNKIYLQFNNSTMFLGIKDNKLFLENEKKYSWVFEKYDNKEKYIQMERFELNKKFYYKKIDTNNNNEIITNFYMGWGNENILY
jgi:hypothetical protein